ncbi:tape measure protein [Furfurilactobacillus entadae]|uniref:tape measure protein n=1 Tax=Furfurilactobacillus entadae TaxID=2922307 RepID=UPI0035E4FDA6
MVKVQNEMATKIAIDTVSATSSMSGLTNAVRSGINAWKADEVALKSVGDSMGAAQAKFDGLGNVIDLQKKKIDELRTRQEGLDTANRQDAETYLKLQNQIDGATRQLASYEAQQNRSKQSLEYYTSGLSDLQRGYKMASEASEAHVNRLIAEGRASDAEKEKLNGLNSAMKNLTEQQKLQEIELEKIAHESGTSSEAYSRQKIRIDETAKAYAEAKSSAKSLEETISHEPTTWFGKARVSLANFRGESQKAEKSSSRLGDIIKGSFVGTALTNGLSTVTSGLKNMVSEGLQFAEAGEKNQVAWKQMGLSAGDIKYLTMEVGELKKATGFAGGEITALQKKFYGMTQSEGLTENLTRGVTALAVASGKGADSADAVASSMRKINASGKLTSQSYQKLIQQVPALPGKLSEALGMTKDQLDKAVADGSISSQKFQDAIVKIGATSGKTFQEFGKTSDGAIAQFKGSWQSIESATAKPIVDVKSSGIESLTKVMNSKETQNMFTNFGKGIAGMADAAGKALGYISAHQKDIGGVIGSLTTITKLLFDGAWEVVAGVVSGIAGAFDKMAGKSKSAHDPLKNIAEALGSISKHSGAIKALGGMILGVVAAVKIWTAAQAALNFVLNANPIGLIVTAIGLLSLGLFELYKHNKKFRDVVNGIGKIVSKVFGGVVKVVKGAFSSIGKLFTGKYGWEKSIGKKFGAVGDTTKKGMSNLGKHVHDGLSLAGKFFTGDLGWEKAISKQLSNVGKSFQKGWKSFTNIVGKLFKGLGKAMIIAIAFPVGLAMILLKPLVKIFSNVISEIGKWWSKNISKPFEDGFKKVGKSVGGWWSSNISKPVSKGLGDIGHSISDGWSSWNKTQESWAKGMYKYWQSHWDNMNKNLGAKWNDMTTTTGKWYDNTNKSFGNWSSNFKKSWGSHWDNVKSSLSDHWNDMYNNSDVFGKSLHGWLDTFTSTFQKNWKGFGDAIGDIWSSAWKSIKNIAHDAMKGVVDIINTGINGIDDVIHLFGGDAKAISPIKFANGTANGRVTHNMIAMLNDGHDSPETGNKEMIVKADGRKQIVQGQDVLAPLEAGDAVVKASDTRDYMYAQGVHHFADGTGLWDSIKSSVGGAANWVGDKVGDVEKWIGDKTKAVTEFFKNPVKKVTEVFDHYISGFKKMAPFTDAFAPSGGHYIIKQGESWFKKLFDKLNSEGGDGDSPKGALPKDKFADIANHAADLMHQSLSGHDIDRLYWQAWDESNVDPATGGGVDDHDGSGLPYGLFQYKLGTWKTWAVNGHANIHSALDQIMAVLNDSNWRGDLAPIGTRRGWGPSGHRMMANGGFISQNQMIEVAEGNKKEAIIPMDITKRSRANQLLMEVLGMFASEDQQNDYHGSKERNDDANQDTAVVKLMQKNNTLLEQNNTLTNTLISIVRALGIDMPSLANHMSNYQALRDFQGS